jgi:hypothetical protein
MDAGVSSTRQQGYIYGGAISQGPSGLLHKAGARVQSPAILVERYKEHFGIMIEYLLGSISMVNISIHNGNPFEAVFLPQVFHHNSFIVNITESPVAMGYGHGMMSRGADNGKTVPNLTLHHRISHNQGRAGRDQMSFGNLRFYIGYTKMHPGNVL